MKISFSGRRIIIDIMIFTKGRMPEVVEAVRGPPFVQSMASVHAALAFS